MKRKQAEVTPLLEVKNLSLSFPSYQRRLRASVIDVIYDLDVTIHPGEIVVVIGASGSGKSLLADTILGIHPDHAIVKGDIFYKGQKLTKRRQQKLRGTEIGLIPQSVNALNPLLKTKKQIQADLSGILGLPENVGNMYPFELSGGMARKVLVTAATAHNAQLIIADEPTPGIEPHILAEMTKQIKYLAREKKGIMWITHDLSMALTIADRIVIMKKGKVVDEARAEDFSGRGEKLTHSYTRRLWLSLPENDFFYHNESRKLGNQKEKKIRGNRTNVLEAKGICYGYDKNAKPLLDKIDLTIHSGEVVGLYGPSGIGKTTLAQILAGYKKPLAGNVHIDGQPIRQSAIHPIQFIWQHPEQAINPKWRIEQVLAESPGMDKTLLKLFGIDSDWMARWPSELSGGELQRVCLVRAFQENTQFLIADEITTMLDAITQAEIWEVVLYLLKERNIGLLAISHDHVLLRRISDRIVPFSECGEGKINMKKKRSRNG